MSLDNLVGRTLEKITPDARMINKLISAAKRNIADAHITQVSAENRFDAAYKAIMQLANAALQANGYRTLTSVPGHHQTMIQTLGKTIGLDGNTIIVLDALRKQRHGADYTGDIVPNSAVTECITYAENLFHDVREWIKKSNPNLLTPPS